MNSIDAIDGNNWVDFELICFSFTPPHTLKRGEAGSENAQTGPRGFYCQTFWARKNLFSAIGSQRSGKKGPERTQRETTIYLNIQWLFWVLNKRRRQQLDGRPLPSAQKCLDILREKIPIARTDGGTDGRAYKDVAHIKGTKDFSVHHDIATWIFYSEKKRVVVGPSILLLLNTFLDPYHVRLSTAISHPRIERGSMQMDGKLNYTMMTIIP
jgi:hypothetical protein